jgi:sarcosine oxidase subunit gamma
MSSVLLRTGTDAFEIMVFRSMARTAWHEVEAALTALAARAALT